MKGPRMIKFLRCVVKLMYWTCPICLCILGLGLFGLKLADIWWATFPYHAKIQETLTFLFGSTLIGLWLCAVLDLVLTELAFEQIGGLPK